jgi:hypothetical protein
MLRIAPTTAQQLMIIRTEDYGLKVRSSTAKPSVEAIIIAPLLWEAIKRKMKLRS